jgi:ABC-type multidrug transport system ATPase subunit
LTWGFASSSKQCKLTVIVFQTGLDPEVRRLIWNIINDARAGKTIILTTHSMEEAEVLSHRIAIQAKGSFRCLGSTLRLKQLYGAGFKIQIACEEERMANSCAFIESLLPADWIKVDAFTTTASYEFKPEPGQIAKIFQTVESRKEELGIDDWGISQTSLEEVFLNLLSDSDAGAD